MKFSKLFSRYLSIEKNHLLDFLPRNSDCWTWKCSGRPCPYLWKSQQLVFRRPNDPKCRQAACQVHRGSQITQKACNWPSREDDGRNTGGKTSRYCLLGLRIDCVYSGRKANRGKHSLFEISKRWRLNLNQAGRSRNLVSDKKYHKWFCDRNRSEGFEFGQKNRFQDISESRLV